MTQENSTRRTRIWIRKHQRGAGSAFRIIMALAITAGGAAWFMNGLETASSAWQFAISATITSFGLALLFASALARALNADRHLI